MLKSNDQNTSVTDKKSWFSEDRLAYISILFTLGMGAATAYALTRVDYLSNDTDFVMWLIMIDALALLVLGTLVGRQIWRLWSERRQRLAGHQLHWRMAVLFGGVTTFPAIIVTLFALFVVDYSLRGWFAERISTAVNESVRVAESYFDEHARSISGEVLTMANDINREAYRLVGKGNLMGRYLSDQAALRNLSDAIIFDGTGQVLAKSQFAFAITFTNLESSWVEKARKGEVVVPNWEYSSLMLTNNRILRLYIYLGLISLRCFPTASQEPQSPSPEPTVINSIEPFSPGPSNLN